MYPDRPMTATTGRYPPPNRLWGATVEPEGKELGANILFRLRIVKLSYSLSYEFELRWVVLVFCAVTRLQSSSAAEVDESCAGSAGEGSVGSTDVRPSRIS